MMIDRLGGIDPLNNVQNTHKANKANKAAQPDSISVSAEAKELSEVYYAMEAAGSAPDVRSDRVAEVLQGHGELFGAGDEVREGVAVEGFVRPPGYYLPVAVELFRAAQHGRQRQLVVLDESF